LSYLVHARATRGSVINGAGQVATTIGGSPIAMALTGGQSWNQSAFCWGRLPTLLPGC
jgi:hypothetical protein